MKLRRLARALDPSLRWAVLFDEEAVSRSAGKQRVHDALTPPGSVLPAETRYVALTDLGICAWSKSGTTLLQTGHPLASAVNVTIEAEYGDLLNLLPSSPVHCLGFGRSPSGDHVVMGVDLSNEDGQASAVFDASPRPFRAGLAAIGVRLLSVDPTQGRFISTFSFDARVHLEAAARARYVRTRHCVDFFLEAGVAGRSVRTGLTAAVESAITSARARTADALHRASAIAVAEGYSMRMYVPASGVSVPYGDNVPLAFAAGALTAAAEEGYVEGAESCAALHASLRARRDQGLWAFQQGGLPTALDTALMLVALGRSSGFSIPSFDQFRLPEGGYRAQRCGSDRGEMPKDPEFAHWCAEDVGTTAAVAALRSQDVASPALMRLMERFDRRASLFFANPFLVDWVIAQALSRQRRLCGYAAQLAAEVIAGQSQDGSFGAFDRELSTSLAILSLASLGGPKIYGGNIRLAQLWLAQSLSDHDGAAISAAPFYSSRLMALTADRVPPLVSARLEEVNGVARSGHKFFEISYYLDDAGLITTALSLQALLVKCPSSSWETWIEPSGQPSGGSAPSASAYIKNVCLPRLTGGLREPDTS